ncbi:hypothetical protein ACPFT9_003516 [Vibrio cholerae]|nr:hypothetical protein [Vibrio cholerae]
MFRKNISLEKSNAIKQKMLNEKFVDITKKAKKHHYKYINPDAVKNVVGKWTPISIWNFSFLLECFISAMSETGISIMNSKGSYKTDIEGVSEALVGVGDKLLKSNSNYKQGQWNLFNGLDFDIVHTCIKDKPVETMVKPYFSFDEFKRGEDESRVVVHCTVAEFDGTPWTISFPLQYIMKGFPKIKGQHFGYCHKIALFDDDGTFDKEYVYIGVTKRNWLKRMSEHFNEIKSGSNKLFHKTWREFTGNKKVMLSSELIVGDHTFDQIMAWEETMVDRCMDDNISLNMIPGGFKGMKFLHKHRLLKSERSTIDERDDAVLEFQKLHPRAGIANLLISELWKNDDYAKKIICGADDRLSVEQVLKIRELNEIGVPVEKITQTVNARNLQQVQRVIKGKTYSRIH